MRAKKNIIRLSSEETYQYRMTKLGTFVSQKVSDVYKWLSLFNGSLFILYFLFYTLYGIHS